MSSFLSHLVQQVSAPKEGARPVQAAVRPAPVRGAEVGGARFDVAGGDEIDEAAGLIGQPDTGRASEPLHERSRRRSGRDEFDAPAGEPAAVVGDIGRAGIATAHSAGITRAPEHPHALLDPQRQFSSQSAQQQPNGEWNQRVARDSTHPTSQLATPTAPLSAPASVSACAVRVSASPGAPAFAQAHALKSLSTPADPVVSVTQASARASMPASRQLTEHERPLGKQPRPAGESNEAISALRPKALPVKAPDRSSAVTLKPTQPPAITPAQHSSIPPSPLVHITIGRIEIRAVTPAAAVHRSPSKPAPRPNRPTLSLADYLAKRGKAT